MPAKGDGMNTEHFSLERKDGIAVVEMRRNERLNAFNESMFEQMEAVTSELARKLPRAIVITGAGSYFSAGFDVQPDNPMVGRIIESASSSSGAEQAGKLIAAIRRSIDGFVSLPVPIIAALNGNAYGGGAELAVRCDLRVMDPGAVICFSEVKLGLMSDWGGGAALVRIAGPSRAADILLSARKVNAEEALALGLCNRVSATGGAMGEALDLAAAIAGNGPNAVRHALALVRQSRDLGYEASLDLEAKLAVRLISSGECFHGVAAFLERKKPVFPDID